MRYAIEENRPGTTIHAAGSFVKAQEDGSYRLTEAQIKDLERRGHKVFVLDKPEPEVYKGVPIINPALAEQKAAADEFLEKAMALPTKQSLAPKRKK